MILDPRVSTPLTNPMATISFPSCAKPLMLIVPLNSPPPLNVPAAGSRSIGDGGVSCAPAGFPAVTIISIASAAPLQHTVVMSVSLV
jgi:hypothetical protein